jgi:hypothetical protein
MARMQVDPKKMAVVKQTITTAAPTGGVPKKSAKEALSYLTAESGRHDKLLKDINSQIESFDNEKINWKSMDGYNQGSFLVGSPAYKFMKQREAQKDQLLKKRNQIVDASVFLMKQGDANREKITLSERAAQRNAEKKAKAIEDAKPFLQKLGEDVKRKVKDMAENPGNRGSIIGG